MAETVGLVSGAITIAHTISELGRTVIQLKALWDKIDAVPQRLQGHVEEVWILGHLLADIDNQLKHTGVSPDIWNAQHVVYAARYCRQVFDTMSSLVEDLRHEIDSSSPLMRRLKATKIVLKKDKIQSLEQQLESACRLLQMCIQTYSIALNKSSCDANAQILSLLRDNRAVGLTEPQRISRHAGTSTDEMEAASREPQCGRYPRVNNKLYMSTRIGKILISASSGNHFVVVTILPPRMLSSLVCGITLSYGLRQFNMRYYNIRPNDSDIFMRIKSKDLIGMLELFKERRASPFDRDEDGLSLLHYAASTKDQIICQKLLELGLDACVDEDTRDDFSPRETAYLVSLWNKRETAENRIAYMNLFQRSSLDSCLEDDYQFLLIGCSSGGSDLVVLSAFQSLVAPSLCSLPACRRLEMARAYCSNGLPSDHPDPDVLGFLAGGHEAFPSTGQILPTENEFSMMHTLAISFGRVCRVVGEPAERDCKGRLARWQQVVMDAIALSTPTVLHNIEKVRREDSINVCSEVYRAEWRGTPLLSVIKGCSLDYFDEISADAIAVRDLWQRISSFALTRWLDQLRNCAVNLDVYGAREKVIFSQATGDMAASFDFVLNFGQWNAGEQEIATQIWVARLRDFEFGPEVGDWSLIWEIGQDVGVTREPEGGRRLLPDTEPRVPGAWIG